MLEPYDLIVGVALHALSVADSLVSSLSALSSAGMPNGLDPGVLAVGASAGGVAGAAAGSGVAGGGAGAPRDYDALYQRMRITPQSARYRTSDGQPYFPGISPIPSSGKVYDDKMVRQLREDGRVKPLPSVEDIPEHRTTASQGAGRG